jgi:hypothetical protein
MHDAAESYIGDMTRPVKLKIGKPFSDFEILFEHLIAKNFGLILPYPREVKEFDNTLLVTEARDLLGGQLFPWGFSEKPLEGTIRVWTPDVAEATFLEEFKILWREK